MSVFVTIISGALFGTLSRALSLHLSFDLTALKISKWTFIPLTFIWSSVIIYYIISKICHYFRNTWNSSLQISNHWISPELGRRIKAERLEEDKEIFCRILNKSTSEEFNFLTRNYKDFFNLMELQEIKEKLAKKAVTIIQPQVTKPLSRYSFIKDQKKA